MEDAISDKSGMPPGTPQWLYRSHIYCCISDSTIPMFTKTRTGNPAILLGGYRYTLNNRSKGPKALWVCTRTSKGCRASITTVNDVIVKNMNVHNHTT